LVFKKVWVLSLEILARFIKKQPFSGIMKSLKFAENLIDSILEGKKDITWRINDNKNISKGDVISLCYKDGKEFAKAEVLWAKEKRFKNLTEEDLRGHEKFSSPDEMYTTYSGYYNQEVGPETEVKIIKYRLVK